MNWLGYRYKLYKLNRRRDKEAKAHSEDIERAKKLNNPDKLNETIQTGDTDLRFTDEDIASLMTRYLRQKATKKFLTVPELKIEGNEFWEQGNMTGQYYLTVKGIAEVRSALRAERKALEESISRWATVIIGIIGALIGLVSVLTRK